MAINLSNIVSAGGRTTASGISSNLDTAAIIEQLSEIKLQPVVDFEEQIAGNSSKVTAFGDLSNVLDALKTAANFLRRPTGFNTLSSNAFEFRASALTSNTTSAASSFLSLIASPGAQIGSHDITISQLAEALTQRSESFTSQTDSITEAAAGSTSGLFSAGTFKITSTANTAIGDKLAASEYVVNGAVAGILTTGIHNVSVTDGDGDSNLQGAVSGFSATVNGSNVDLSVTINGNAYTATVAANTGGGSDSIAAGVFTLTNGTTGTSFDLELTSAYVIGGVQGNADNFASDLDTALASQSVYQSRGLGNFDNPNSGDLFGLKREHVQLESNGFSLTDGTHGSFGKFTVTGVTTTGANDASISVIINGETFEATGLGTDTDDTHTANITLSSTTTDKELHLDINTAGVTLDFSSATTAASIEDALDEAFNLVDEEITIDEGDSLLDITSKINTKSTETNVSASIFQVSDSDFRLNLKSDKDGIANAYSIVDSTGVLSDVAFTTTQAAQNSLFTVDGVSIERGTNTVDDVLKNTTINFFQTTTATSTTVTADITRDTTTANTAIQNFLNAYNDFRIFFAKQTERESDGFTFTEDAILRSDTTLNSLESTLSSEIVRTVSNTSDSDFSRLFDAGVDLADFDGDGETPAVNNILTFDSTVLDDLLATDFEKLREIFEFEFNPSSSVLSLFKSSNDVTITDFQVDIDTGRAAGNEVRILDSNGGFLYNATLSGSKIIGQDGTSIEGLEILYTGDGTDVVTVSISQGIADRIYNLAEEAIEDDGLIDDAVEALNDEDTRIEDEITKIELQVDLFRQTLLNQFSAMEEAIARVNILLDFLDLQSQSVFSSGS